MSDYIRPGSPLIAVQAERKRQIDSEGWTAAHDDKHTNGELFEAAACYYAEATGQNDLFGPGVPSGWPWAKLWWKPTTPRRNLEKAGALLFAERDRLMRLQASGEQQDFMRVSLGITQVLEALEKEEANAG